MEVSLLDFVQECRHLAKQALGTRAGEPASGGFARWMHVVLHCIRIEDEYSYRELVDRVALMDAICDELEFDPADVPESSTICKSFDRFKMWVWRQLLRASAQNCLPPATPRSTGRTSSEHSLPSITAGGRDARYGR